MSAIFASLVIIFSIVFLIVFLVYKSEETIIAEDDYQDYVIKIKISKKRRDCIGKRKNSG
ncbi:MAG: hypothetical protein ACI3XA_01205 [Clostridia bacterium]